MQKSRTDYLDHIKIVLTILVILHHACVCYGAPGGWYFRQPSQLEGALIAMTVFVNAHSTFMSRLSREAFAVYIFHPLPLIVFALLLADWNVDPALKLLIVAPLGIISALLLGKILVKIPGVNKVI